VQRKLCLTGLIVLCLVLTVTGCQPATTTPTPSGTNTSAWEKTISELEKARESIQSDYAELQADYAELQDIYQKMREGVQQSTLRNPTWAELKEFLERDTTDTLTYSEDSFDCTGYAIMLRDQAMQYGIRCAFVEITFTGVVGHALNAFETTDRGTVYVDTTKSDKIAYISINQPYGVIPLDSVKAEHISCSGAPSEFYKPLTYTTHPNPFSYSYFTDYQNRLSFYRQTVTAYNQAGSAYQSGNTALSSDQLTQWMSNIDALEEELGAFLDPDPNAVRVIQLYWN